MDEPKMSTSPIEDVHVAIIGTGTGDGGAAPLTTGTVAKTPDHQPNLVVRVISPLVAIGVRFGYTFCISLAGLLSGGGLDNKLLPHSDMEALFRTAITLSLCIAGVGFLKDCGTLFSGLEKKFPLASGSV